LGCIVFLLGVPSALSAGQLANFTILKLTFFQIVDFISANIFLPLGGILIALFVGWFWGTKNAVPHLLEGTKNFPAFLASTWTILIRFVAPVLISLIFLSSIGII